MPRPGARRPVSSRPSHDATQSHRSSSTRPIAVATSPALERITLELFSAEALAPLPVTPVRAPGRKAMMVRQTLDLPWRALKDPDALVLCPGFPPSIPLTLLGRGRVIPYIHDLFLLTRPDDLNRRAKLYMVAPFRLAVRRLPLFLVNSETTATELRRFCRPDARIAPYRPQVRNVFGLDPGDRATRPSAPGTLRLVAVGTVEPRKNLPAAAAILATLRRTTHPHVTLDIVGRPGWGVDTATLAAQPGVTLHGYQPSETVRRLIEAADALLSTAHDEGLGLPLLEAQYAGLPVIAPAPARVPRGPGRQRPHPRDGRSPPPRRSRSALLCRVRTGAPASQRRPRIILAAGTPRPREIAIPSLRCWRNG